MSELEGTVKSPKESVLTEELLTPNGTSAEGLCAANLAAPKKAAPLPAGDKAESDRDLVVKKLKSEALNRILAYNGDSGDSSSSSSDGEDEEDDEDEMVHFQWKNRKILFEKGLSSSSSSNSSSSSSSEVESEELFEEEDDESAVTVESESKGAIRKEKPTKTGAELGIDDLPPVPDLSKLNLNTDNETFMLIGHVAAIVDRLVTIAALPNSPAYDVDTVFFLENGKRPLGMVFDVLGQVTSPIYAVRFNSVDEIHNLKVVIGQEVYAAPSSRYTQYVFLQQLLKMKGSDASWLGDTEVPAEFADYSDDDDEYYQHSHQNSVLANSTPSSGGGGGGGNKRPLTTNPSTSSTQSNTSDEYKLYETTMNKRNLLNTKLNRYMDTYRSRQRTKQQNRHRQQQQQQQQQQINSFNNSSSHSNSSNNSFNNPPPVLPPDFNPLVPPPNLMPFFNPTNLDLLQQSLNGIVGTTAGATGGGSVGGASSVGSTANGGTGGAVVENNNSSAAAHAQIKSFRLPNFFTAGFMASLTGNGGANNLDSTRQGGGGGGGGGGGMAGRTTLYEYYADLYKGAKNNSEQNPGPSHQ